MHRDLKTENVLIFKNGQAKIADLGLAKQMHYRQNVASNTIVTLAYRAPEIILGEQNYLYSVDIWSMGCIMIELLSNNLKIPFLYSDDEEQSSVMNAQDQQYMPCAKTLALIFSYLGLPTELPTNPYARCMNNNEFKKTWPLLQQQVIERRDLREGFGIKDLEALDLIKKCLRLDPDERITCHEALQHSYFKDVLGGQMVVGGELYGLLNGRPNRAQQPNGAT